VLDPDIGACFELPVHVGGVRFTFLLLLQTSWATNTELWCPYTSVGFTAFGFTAFGFTAFGFTAFGTMVYNYGEVFGAFKGRCRALPASNSLVKLVLPVPSAAGF
jgi:hypothetical protein